jgi:2-oxoisovalerate dehydrogenase E1 component
VGLSINGYKAIVEMQFADFVSTGFNPIVNLLAKSHYRWLEKADVVVTHALRQWNSSRTVSFANLVYKTPGLKAVLSSISL